MGGDTHTEDPENSLALFSSEHDLENCNPDSHGQIKQSGPAAVIATPPFKRRITGDSFPFLTPLCEVTPEKINCRAACLKMSSKKNKKTNQSYEVVSCYTTCGNYLNKTSNRLLCSSTDGGALSSHSIAVLLLSHTLEIAHFCLITNYKLWILFSSASGQSGTSISTHLFLVLTGTDIFGAVQVTGNQ